MEMDDLSIEQNVKLAVNFLLSKKVEDVTVIDLRGCFPYSDFFVIGTVQSTLHANSLVSSLREELKKNRIMIHHVEGEKLGEWLLIDCVDFVIHLFLPETRQLYSIEELFADQPQKRFFG